MVHGSEWEENAARHPHTAGSLYGYQKKEIAKGAICKCLKRKSRKSSGEGSATRSRMRIVGIHPVVFVRVASKGLTGYGTWKSAQTLEQKRFRIAELWNCGSKGIAIAGEERT